MTPSLRLGFDIGGTFTDFVLADPGTGAMRLHKRLTTPEDPSIGALDGLRQIIAGHGARFADVAEIVHGTTLVTNAVIGRNGARLGLITTAGFRDVLEAGTEQRYDIYDLFLTYPDPLVPRRRRLEVAERIDRDGQVVTALDAEGVRRAAQTLREAKAEAVAICFLNAYREPKHEREAAAIVRAELPGVPVSISSEVAAEIGGRRACGGAAGCEGWAHRPARLRHGRHHRQGLPDRGRPRPDRPAAGSRARAPVQEGLGAADQGGDRRHDRDRRRRRLDCG